MRPYGRISTHMPFSIRNSASIPKERLVSVMLTLGLADFSPPHQSLADQVPLSAKQRIRYQNLPLDASGKSRCHYLKECAQAHGPIGPMRTISL